MQEAEVTVWDVAIDERDRAGEIGAFVEADAAVEAALERQSPEPDRERKRGETDQCCDQPQVTPFRVSVGGVDARRDSSRYADALPMPAIDRPISSVASGDMPKAELLVAKWDTCPLIRIYLA
jgi:hypothetical protein